MKHVRNFGIVLALSAAVYALPGGGTAAELVQAVLYIAFTVGIGLLGARAYREHRSSLYALGDRWRLTLYAAVGLIVLLMAGTTEMFETGVGTLLWLALLAAAIYALVAVFRASREY